MSLDCPGAIGTNSGHGVLIANAPDAEKAANDMLSSDPQAMRDADYLWLSQ